MFTINPASLRVTMVAPPTSVPKALPFPLQIGLGAIDRLVVNVRESYMPLVVAKNDAMASTPTQGRYMTDVSSTGFGAKAAANSFVPFLRTSARQLAPGDRAGVSEGIGFPRAKLKTIKLNRLGTVCRELRTALKIGKARHGRNPDR